MASVLERQRELLIIFFSPPCVKLYHPRRKSRCKDTPQLWKKPSQRTFDGVFAARITLHGRRCRHNDGRRPCCAAPCGPSPRTAQLSNFWRRRRWRPFWTAVAVDAGCQRGDAAAQHACSSCGAAAWQGRSRAQAQIASGISACEYVWPHGEVDPPAASGRKRSAQDF